MSELETHFRRLAEETRELPLPDGMVERIQERVSARPPRASWHARARETLRARSASMAIAATAAALLLGLVRQAQLTREREALDSRVSAEPTNASGAKEEGGASASGTEPPMWVPGAVVSGRENEPARGTTDAPGRRVASFRPPGDREPLVSQALQGTLAPSDVMTVVIQNKHKFFSCFVGLPNRERKRVLIRFQIEPSGKVSSAVPDQEGPPVECLCEQVRSMRFPKHKKRMAPVSFPFQF